MVAGTKRGDESRHVGMPLQTPEGLDGFEHACGDPSQHHLPATPALHLPLHVSGATQQTLGGIRCGEGSLEPRGELEGDDRQRLLAPFADTAGGARILVVEAQGACGACSATRCRLRASTRSTSTTTSRPAYATTGRNSTAGCARSGTGHVLVVWKLDRLGRTLAHLVNTVQDLSARGVGLRVLTGQGAQIDTTTAAGRLVFGIFAALADVERELIRERTMAGLKAARARGRDGGRKFALSKAQVRLAQAAMAHRDTSVSELCRELGHQAGDALPVRRTPGPVA